MKSDDLGFIMVLGMVFAIEIIALSFIAACSYYLTCWIIPGVNRDALGSSLIILLCLIELFSVYRTIRCRRELRSIYDSHLRGEDE